VLKRRLAITAILIAAIAIAGIVAGQMQGWFTLILNPKPDDFNATSTPTTNPTATPSTISNPDPATSSKPQPQQSLTPLPTPKSNTPTPTATPLKSHNYTHTSLSGHVSVTYDGKWTNNNEWSEVLPTAISENISFRDKISSTGNSTVLFIWQPILVETPDNTMDPHDYWEICVDGKNDGGIAPQPDDFKINIVGTPLSTGIRETEQHGYRLLLHP
jgi:hypothetical protein